jgi:hypothetical protein
VGIPTRTIKINFVKNIKAFFGFLGDRLQDKPIQGSIKVGDNEIQSNFSKG